MSGERRPAVLERITEQAACIRLPGQRLAVWFLDERNIILFDSGLAEARQLLTDCLEENGLCPRALVTSHAHIDHTGNHRYLQERFGTRIWMTGLDRRLSSSPEALMLLFPNFGRRSLMATASSMLCRCEERIPFEEGELTVEGVTVGVIPLPGHTPCHVGFLLPDGTAYLGDLLMSRRILERTRFPFSLCWITDIQSKRRALQMEFPHAVLAHNEVCRDVPALARDNLTLLRQRLQELLDEIRPMDTVSDIIRRLYDGQEERRHSGYELVVIDSGIRYMIYGLADLGCLALEEQMGTACFVPTGEPVPSLL